MRSSFLRTSFIASALCVLQAGAIPVFADVHRETHTLDPRDVERKITSRTRAILPVHLYGIPCDMDEIMALARAHNLFIIEDCAQAHGSEYKGKKVGSIGHAGAFSFCQPKHCTTGGEGGCVVTNDAEIFLASKILPRPWIQRERKYSQNALPIWKSLYDDPELIAQQPELIKVAKEQIHYIFDRPQVPWYSQFSIILSEELQAALTGAKTPKQAMDDAVARTQEVMERYGK
ncbi:DegT/DnrJ/EryC1/StrS family aminotransferase [Candidatus Caldatribacterium sp.]|uniref:DegT/DnrJ/EryC1/StrS family aminotransferase n=1 Tax=Candidatus Caldatribacterium sp. TaxID=2282143 RepID=UPI0038495928|nr:DegT/DnrJ/EryC1/StrS family aminotransferase [Candidatus Caldatribacterium sp.]